MTELRAKSKKFRAAGFSLPEMLVVVLIFTVLAGAIFELLAVSQVRFKTESEFLDTFQSGRVALDQIIRDVHNAGYPPANVFTSAAGAAGPQNVALPFSWMPSYPGTPCTPLHPNTPTDTAVSSCTNPTGFDIIVEANETPLTTPAVKWIRYQLNGTTLYRGTAVKNTASGHDPVTDTAANLIPYVDNVMNNPGAATIATIQGWYPSLFPSNAAVPIFTYTIDSGQQSDPTNIREVNITLILQAPNPDPSTNQTRILALTGQARRENPRK